MGYAPAQPPAAPRISAGPVNDTLLGTMLAAAGAIGLGCTLLPLITFRMDSDALIEIFGGDLSRSDREIIGNSAGSIDFGFYDFLSSSLLISAAIPLALILALFAGGALLAGYSSKSLMALSGLSSVVALLLVAFLAIRPTNTFSGALDGRIVDSAEQLPVGWSFGVGLYISVFMVAIAAALAIWSHLRRR